MKDALDAYADGVTQAFRKIRSGEAHLPPGLTGIPTDAFTDWTGVDSLAIGRFQTYELSYDADGDIENQSFFDAARSTFTAADPDPVIARRAGLERDLFRFAPGDPATTTTGYPILGAKAHAAPRPAPPHLPEARTTTSSPPRLRLPRGHARDARHVHAGGLRVQQHWAVAPPRSATRPLAGRQRSHLSSLSAPSVFWPVSIEVKAPAEGDPSGDFQVRGPRLPRDPGHHPRPQREHRLGRPPWPGTT